MEPQNNAREAVRALSEMLTPNGSGVITFGARHEPLRQSQVEGLTAIKQHLESGETKGHIVMPGGSGKTRLGIALAYAMYKHDRNSLFVVPSQQALRDFVNKANDLGLFGQSVGAVYEGEKRIGKLTFITYASLLRRVLGDEAAADVQELAEADHRDAAEHREAPPPQQLRIDPKTFDLAIWDEAHMYLTRNAQNLMGKFDHAVNIGLTATPRYYEGKEVGHVFGKKILEVELNTAKQRGEICDFENILIDTGIRTGIQLTSPDQEESAQVSGAINRRDRNLIFADLYKDAEITVNRKDKQKKYTLAGEPTIVFGASINHVHDMADAINAALTPALKSDSVFRERLRAKGINPDDPELVIAAPIHTNASETHAGMSLEQRNALVERYHNRKVLMMCATSVLQQSFDSPMTSVVMDAVPRQTYVGVGQAGMRATRPGKEMAIIINTQDADHPSHTFEDFRNNRGHEEGVAIEIANRKGNARSRKLSIPVAGSHEPVAHYNLTYGAALNELAIQRRKQLHALSLYTDQTLDGRVGGEKYERVNQLILDIAAGRHEAETKLIEEICPWMERTKNRIAYQEIPNHEGYEEKIEDAALDVLTSCIGRVQSGAVVTWSRFGQNFQTDLRKRLLKLPNILNEPQFSQLTPPIKPRDLIGNEVDPLTYARDAERNDAIDHTLDSLPFKDREVIKLRYGHGDGYAYTLDEVGRIFKVTRECVRQIEARAKNKLCAPGIRPGAVRDWLEDQHEPLDDAIMAQKRIIRSCLGSTYEGIDYFGLSKRYGISEIHICTLTDIDSTDYPALKRALHQKTIDKIIAELSKPESAPSEREKFTQAVDELRRLCERRTNRGRPDTSSGVGLS